MDCLYSFDVCPDCSRVFRADTKNDAHCACGRERLPFVHVEYKSFQYRSIVAYIRRLFANPVSAQHATYARDPFDARQLTGATWPLEDYCDGAAYKEYLEKNKNFAEERRNIVMFMSVDGMCPFALAQRYSIWPILLTPLSLPPWIRHAIGITTCIGITPGSRAIHSTTTGNKKARRRGTARFKLRHAMEVAVNELSVLENEGVLVHDAFKGEVLCAESHC